MLDQIREVHQNSRGTYGSPRITKALNKKGFICGKNRVARLMQENGIAAKTKRKYKATTNSKHNYPIAARGLDIEGVTHIFNLDLPEDVKEYLHRVGRAARGGEPGTAVSIVTKRETIVIKKLEKILNQVVK